MKEREGPGSQPHGCLSSSVRPGWPGFGALALSPPSPKMKMLLPQAGQGTGLGWREPGEAEDAGFL